ncbi:MAG: hypothetical protein AB1938_01585 [Myxococcota bacterium]
MRTTSSRLVLVAAVTTALVASAQASLPGYGKSVRPRVLVIVDTSRSMGESPDGTSEALLTDPGGDYDPESNPNMSCVNKFCSAKKVVYLTLPNFTDRASIGLATYYQYVLREETASTAATTCVYDVLLPDGLTRTFTSTSDYTGSGGTTGGTAANVVPDWMNASCTSSGACCNTGSGAIGTRHRYTAIGTRHRYTVTKTTATPSGVATYDCRVYSPVSTPKTYMTAATRPSGCALNTVYELTGGSVVVGDGTGPDILQVFTSAPTCAARVDHTGTTPAGGPTTTYPTSGTWRNLPWGGASCTSETPCNLYSVSNVPQTAGSRYWFGFFDPATTSHNTTFTQTGLGYDFSSPKTVTGSATTTLTGTLTNQTTCPTPATPVTSGNIGAWGFSVNVTPGANPGGGLTNNPATPSIHQTPSGSWTGGTFNCTAGWPCEVTFVSQVPGAWNKRGTVYETVVPAGFTYSSYRFNAMSDQNYQTTKPGGSCAGTYVNTDNTAPQGSWRGTALTGCSNTNGYRCTLTWDGNNGATASVRCPSQTTWNNGASPPTATCAASGGAYTLSSTNTMNLITRNIPGTSGSCAAAGTSIPDSSTASSQGYSGCGGYPCTLVTFNSGASGNQQTWATSSPGSTWAATGVTRNAGSPVGYGTKARQALVTTCAPPPVSPSTPLGPQPTGENNCLTLEGNPTAPCYQCQYQPLEYEYRRTHCEYYATSKVWTAPNTIPVCNYARKRYQLQYQLLNCNYSMPIRRYEFNQPTEYYCRYYAIGTELGRQGYNFTYSYATKGGELWGEWRKALTGPLYSNSDTDTTYQSNATFRADCPATISDCTGTISGSVCKLRKGRAYDGAGQYGTGRWQFNRDQRTFSSGQLQPPNRECPSEDMPGGTGSLATWDAPQSNAVIDANKSYAIEPTGSLAQVSHKLVSDYYDPSRENLISDLKGVAPKYPTSSTLDWSKTNSYRTSGWGAEGGNASTLPTPSQVFIPVPHDAPANPSGEAAALRDAMRKCELPGPGNVSPLSGTNYTPHGICMVSEADRAAPGWTPAMDFTPLYGSLTNAAKYMADEFDNDTAYRCRDYYLVLATDGKENTPANYTDADLVDKVTSFRSLTTPNGRTMDLRTFVIGFGSGAAGSPSLDLMATAGTGAAGAFSATDITSLQTALNAVFSKITEGIYSRSKPAIATNGTRIYAAQFQTLGGSPEWSGELTAFRVQNDGTLAIAWEHSKKVNTQTDGSRYFKAVIGGTVSNFDTGNSTLVDRLDDDWSYPNRCPNTGCWDTRDIIRMVRNPNLNCGSTPCTNGEPFRASSAQRLSRVGSINHSNPIIVGPSPFQLDWGGSTPAERTAFSTFLDSTKTRQPRVLYGSNDGVMRAVVEDPQNTNPACSPNETDTNCENGREAWGFVPEPVMDKLYEQMTGGFLYTVDGQISVGDICNASSGDASDCTASDWKTIAIQSFRDGARSLFAVDVTNPSSPQYMWTFNGSDMGWSYAAPAIGRVKTGGQDRFVAVAPCGKRTTTDGDTLSDWEDGRCVYVIGANSGNSIAKYQRFNKGSGGGDEDWEGNVMPEFPTRPAIHRIFNSPYLFSAVIPGSNGALYVMRFTKGKSDDDPQEDTKKWKPEEFWDPSDDRNSFVSGTSDTMIIRTVVVDPSGTPLPDGGVLPAYKQVNASTDGFDNDNDGETDESNEDDLALPNQGVHPIYNRPKVASVMDATGRLPDYYFGTGNTFDPANPHQPNSYSFKWNYFVGVHDANERRHGSKNGGESLFMNYFLDAEEQVVSEPALVNGAVIVATYTPPSGDPCDGYGDTTLYCFDPRNGNLVNCLVYGVGSPYAGSNTSVLKMGGVGIPSDLVVINNSLFFNTSNSGVQSQQIKQIQPGGDVRSFRRIR